MSGERIHWELNRPYGFDEDFCFRYGEKGQKILKPCEPIPDKDLCLGIIDNSVLKPKRLRVFPKDREVIKVTIPRTGDTIELPFPGKSALLILEPRVCDRQFVKEAVLTTFGFNHASGLHLHVATIREVESAGWLAFWAPLQLKRLIDHVRLVAVGTITTGADPTETDTQNLSQVLRKIC